jgi:hypothetical protein
MGVARVGLAAECVFALLTIDHDPLRGLPD